MKGWETLNKTVNSQYAGQKLWYMVNVTGKEEQNIKENIIEKLNVWELTEQVDEIVIFYDDVVTRKVLPKNSPELPKKMNSSWTVEGDNYVKTKTTRKNKFPGYIFIHADLDDRLFSLIRNIPGVMGFSGIKGRPVPLSDIEYKKMTGKEITKAEISTVRKARKTVDVHTGMWVNVIQGPYNGTKGKVIKVDGENVSIEFEIMGKKDRTVVNILDLSVIV